MQLLLFLSYLAFFSIVLRRDLIVMNHLSQIVNSIGKIPLFVRHLLMHTRYSMFLDLKFCYNIFHLFICDYNTDCANAFFINFISVKTKIP
jgi:hypothetical protein